MTSFAEIISSIASFLWGWPLLVLLLGTHLFFTIRLHFVQRHIFKGIRLALVEDKSGGDISQFGALCTSLAATVGTGNIIGVAVAVSAGGPGAVLWIWLTGVFGIATKYAEGLLAIKYRKKNKDGSYSGGPMYALEHGLHCKWLAILFAVFTVLASFGIGSTIQSNTIASTMRATFGVDEYLTAFVVFVLAGATMLGGIKSIARVCNRLVPFMVLLYFVGCVSILCVGYNTIIDSVCLIVKSAFTGQAATGGFLGSTVMMTMRDGVARGLFSNESGMGSAPIVAASARTKNPVRQALVSSSATFFDTVIICALTGLVVVNTGVWKNDSQGFQIAKEAFDTIPYVGSLFLSVGLITFTFSTILGWSVYAEKSIEYLCGKKSVVYYRLCYLLAIFAGAIMSLDLVWNLGDIFNGLMAIPNLISLLLLSGVIVKETRHYLWNKNLDEE